MSVQRRLRADLAAALRDSDRTEVSMLRTLISALENAEAVEVEGAVDVNIAFRPDTPRRELTDHDVERVLQGERAELVEAAARYRELGLDDEAGDLELRLRIVDRYLTRLP